MFPAFEILSMQFYSYPLLLGVIWAVGFEYGKILNQNIKNYNFFFLAVFLASWIFAKLLFLINLDESVSAQLLQRHSFWLGGGFVFLGGLIGGGAVILLHWKIRRQKFSDYEFLILPLVLGHAIGRIACFLAGCCYGSHSDLPWAIELHNDFRHPVQLYESFALFGLFFFLRHRYQKKRPIFGWYLIIYGVLRFILEFFRGDQIRGIYFNTLSTSQILSLLMIVIFAALQLRRDKGSTH